MSLPEPTHGDADAEVCYRHPNRETGVTCQRCDRYVCGECGMQASVGVHCPECRKGSSQQVYNSRNLPGQQFVVTTALFAVNALVWVFTIVALGSTVSRIGQDALQYSTDGQRIADGELWRVFSGGFLHNGIFHIGFNMYLLWQLGRQLERELGPKEFGLAYVVSLVGGSLGAVLLTPLTPVVGASGAVFGLIAMTVLFYRSRGIGLFDTGLGFLVLINFFYSFQGGVSLGGHLGGAVVGLVLGALIFGFGPADPPLIEAGNKRLMIIAALGVLLVGATYAASLTWQNPLFG